jgi:hypothetical protein
MASRFSKGDYVAQIFAYEGDKLRLLQQAQQYVMAGNALYAAIFTCRYSGNPSAIEKRAIATGSSRRPHNDLDHDRSTEATSTARQGSLDGDLTLTLLHIDTTWRFDDFDNRQASPMLSWPAIRKFFTPGAFLEGDLILKDQYIHPDTSAIPRKSHARFRLEQQELTCREQPLQHIYYMSKSIAAQNRTRP